MRIPTTVAGYPQHELPGYTEAKQERVELRTKNPDICSTTVAADVDLLSPRLLFANGQRLGQN